MINFPFGTYGKCIILGVPILKHITVLAILLPFQQYFSHIRTMVIDNERLCAMEPHL